MASNFPLNTRSNTSPGHDYTGYARNDAWNFRLGAGEVGGEMGGTPFYSGGTPFYSYMAGRRRFSVFLRFSGFLSEVCERFHAWNRIYPLSHVSGARILHESTGNSKNDAWNFFFGAAEVHRQNGGSEKFPIFDEISRFSGFLSEVCERFHAWHRISP